MAEVVMTKCDAPKCEAIAPPEDGRRSRGLLPCPYGWWRVTAYAMGTGPSVVVTCCSLDHVEAALGAAVESADW